MSVNKHAVILLIFSYLTADLVTRSVSIPRPGHRELMYEYRRRARWLRSIPAPSKIEAVILASVVALLLGEVAFFWFRQHS
ncbi:MAG TPA: hypothetical protein VJO52_05455 [Gemmatimonadaceae bacterium]|nr:hypothetical protein [Gemmatimonadaceae bacterium]